MHFLRQYAHDQKIWNDCAQTYEDEIVLGHPDITAYQQFEEELLDRLLLFLIRDLKQEVLLYDVGCGSGRLHLRYGLLLHSASSKDVELRHLHASRGNIHYVPLIAQGLKRIGGLDFSREMLALARQKIEKAGLSDLLDNCLYFEQGSAFELAPFPASPIPVVVTLCNSIGVMQGAEGARQVFCAMRRAVEAAGGIAIVSGYCREAVASYALGNYESTMNVSGQPVWLAPDTYALPQYTQQPCTYKYAHDPDDTIRVDVYDDAGKLIHAGHLLQRIPEATEQTIASGYIRTYHEYESHWYGTEQFRAWMREWWPAELAWHITGKKLDALRAAPAQLAILDAGNHMGPFFERLGVTDRFCKV